MAALALGTSGVFAADHAEAPGTMADLAGDLTDVYAWTADGKLVVVVDFAGLQEPGTPATYDADMLYGIHIDNDGDNQPDLDTWVRFGQNGAGEWGVQVVDLPGGDALVEGAVETTIDAGGGLRVFAGLRDDPFFFDLDGFKATLMTGTVMFDSNNDHFAGTNVTSIVVEMDVASVGTEDIQLWATTGRK
ncbi:DUF4331 family protein [Nannocystaceae bacterium ST9]